MENLAETLGSRPERKPLYGIDDSDDAVLFPFSFLFIYLF